jgi:hypothetical protein
MEWVSYLAEEPHSHAPDCVSPVLRVFCTALTDALGDGARRRLPPYLPRTIGTAEDGLDETRSWMALDWLIRVYAPTWLEAARLPRSAAALAVLPPVLDTVVLRRAIRALRGARVRSRSAWAATLGARRFAARVPCAAGRAAAREAAWRSLGAPAWAAAAVGVRNLACDRASAICRQIAGDTASTLIRTERNTAERAARRDSASPALAPTLERL